MSGSSSSKTGIPDAWDDDWTSTAAASKPRPDVAGTPAAAAAGKISKAERRAQHLAQQKQLWDSADNPGRHLWLEAQGAVVPLRQELKPPVMTLLSRKPPPIARRAGAAGDDEDSEEEARKKQVADMEERQRRAKLEHEDKQRRYAEARERIMGTGAAATSSRESSQHGREQRRQQSSQQQQRPRNNFQRKSQSGSPAEQSPARTGGNERPPSQQQLFDPEGSGRRLIPRRENSDTALREDLPMRQPRGPESAGRGGFGFAPRGGRATA